MTDIMAVRFCTAIFPFLTKRYILLTKRKRMEAMDLPVREEILQRAMRLHRTHPVVDAHLDLAGEILLRRGAGEKSIIRNRYLKQWRQAGIALIVCSVYVPDEVLLAEGTEGAWQNGLHQLEALYQDMADTPEVMPVRNRAELARAMAGEAIGILVYMEGLDGIGEQLERLEELYEMGVRGASLTWSRQNALASGCCRAGQHLQISGGLTKLGKEAVKEMERLSMFLDVSHLNDDGFEDVKKTAVKPFCATHSNARDVYDNYRNLTVSQLKYLAEQEGVAGLNGCRYIAGSLAGNHLEMLCRHLEYEVNAVGECHVGFGFDLCDSYGEARRLFRQKQGMEAGGEEKEDCLLSHGQIPLLTAALLQRGMEEEKVIRVMGENFAAYFARVLPPG